MKDKRNDEHPKERPMEELNDFSSVAMSTELTGLIPTLSDDALEVYEEVYWELYGMPNPKHPGEDNPKIK